MCNCKKVMNIDNYGSHNDCDTCIYHYYISESDDRPGCKKYEAGEDCEYTKIEANEVI